MTTQLDYTWGIGAESVYGVPVTPSRFFDAECSMKVDQPLVQGKPLRAGKRVLRANRVSMARREISGDMEIDVPTKSFGFLLGAVLGATTNTLVPSSNPARYQQNHTLRTTDPVSSYTIQECLPTLGGGPLQPHTFTGCVAESLELSAKEGETLKAKIAWQGKDFTSAQAAAAAVFPADDALFTFVHGAISLAGTLTPATPTTLASMSGTPAANISEISVSVKNNLDKKGFNLGGGGRRSRVQVLGQAEVGGKITAEYTDNTLRDAYLARTPLSLLLNFAHDDGVSVLQVAVPSLILKGEVPTSNGGDPITQGIDFDVLDNGVATSPITITYVSTDTLP